MVIFKQPGIGGEVRWHQDATFFDTTPISVTTFWFALEDATRTNGCLWVQPGGHRGPLRERFVRSADDIVTMEKLDSMPWPDESTAFAVEVSAGSLVVMHGLLPHYSAPNRSAVSRLAYTLHVTDGRSVYSARNWLQRSAQMPVTGFETRPDAAQDQKKINLLFNLYVLLIYKIFNIDILFISNYLYFILIILYFV